MCKKRMADGEMGKPRPTRDNANMTRFANSIVVCIVFYVLPESGIMRTSSFIMRKGNAFHDVILVRRLRWIFFDYENAGVLL